MVILLELIHLGASTVENGHKIIKKWGENNIIALKQQLLGIILCFFYAF